MLDALEVGNPHEVTIRVSHDHNVTIYVQIPTTAEVVVNSQSILGFASENRVMVPKRVLRVQGKIGETSALRAEREPLPKVKVLRPHSDSIVIKEGYGRHTDGAGTFSRNRVQ